MTFYAQRGEDRKLLELIGDKPTGFYIDVGAWEPVNDSVTKHFYDKGWCGINIEPVPEYYAMLIADRPRDVTVQCAVSDTGGGQTHSFNRIEMPGRGETPETGLSTFDPTNTQAAVARAGFIVSPIPVRVYTLTEICDEFLAPGTEIDFLKIDVEGWEGKVIAGMDWSRYRPRFLCIESTVPMTDIPAWSWEPMLLAAGYAFIEFDGLNRYYRDAR